MNAPRDLAAELAADNAKRELEALRDLRAAVLEADAMLSRGARYKSEPSDVDRLTIFFDQEGMGPHVTVMPVVVCELAQLARKADQ